jgi:hypothetical protein
MCALSQLARRNPIGLSTPANIMKFCADTSWIR